MLAGLRIVQYAGYRPNEPVARHTLQRAGVHRRGMLFADVRIGDRFQLRRRLRCRLVSRGNGVRVANMRHEHCKFWGPYDLLYSCAGNLRGLYCCWRRIRHRHHRRKLRERLQLQRKQCSISVRISIIL